MRKVGLTNQAVLDAATEIWKSSQGREKIPIWLDCDTGHDDAFAILLCATWPGFNLLGISTVHGNSSLRNTTSNTLSILEAIGRRDVPVFPGAAKPFCREAAHAESIHGESGLDGTTILPQPVAQFKTHPCGTIAAMYEALAKYSGIACLVSTGSLTNIGLLFAAHPDLAQSIAQLSIMGGAVGSGFTNAPMGRLSDRLSPKMTDDVHINSPQVISALDGAGIQKAVSEHKEARLVKENAQLNDQSTPLLLEQAKNGFGNWSPFAEFNIYCDPEAASSVFSNKTLASKTTLIPLDLTHQVLATPVVLQLLKHGAPTKAPITGQISGHVSTPRLLFHEIITFFASTYASEFGMHEGPPLHDPLAVAAIMAPRLFNDCQGERFEVAVITTGEERITGNLRRKGGDVGQCGRIVAELLKKGKSGIRIPRALEVDVFWHILNKALETVDANLLR